jgi:hypothetical protein
MPAEELPLVSCIMATCDRTEWAAHAVDLFLAQDYPRLELVIVEDGAPGLAAQLPRDPRLRLDAAGGHSPVGTLRNRACAQVRGEIVVGWDDDDWYAPDRVSAQVAPICAGRADLTGLADFTWFDACTGGSWRLLPEFQEHLLHARVNCGTVAFRTELLRRGAAFPDDRRGSDLGFVLSAVEVGGRLEPVDGAERYVYVRHGANTWDVEIGVSAGADAWAERPLPPGADLSYCAATPAVAAYRRRLVGDGCGVVSG